MRRRRTYGFEWIGLAALAIGLAGCGSSDEGKPLVTANISGGDGSGQATEAVHLTTTDSPPPKSPADLRHPEAVLETSAGRITVRLDAENAPGTVANFLNLANSGYYDETTFHYVSAGDMILGGGFDAKLEPKEPQRTIRNEAHNGLSNKRGTLAMTRTLDDIDSASSQFFINLADHTDFDYRGDDPADYGYCVFGEIVEGLDVAQRISKAPTATKGQFVMTPLEPVVIQSIRQTK